MLKKKSLIVIVLFVVILLGFVFYSAKIRSGVSLLWNLAFNKSVELKKDDGSINILLLGIGGGKHDGPDLSDTIILANIQPAKNEINLISIPRDLWIPDLKAKVNSAYSTGQDKGNKGIILADAAVEKVVGKQIDYTVVVDFSGFVKLIDLLGGVDVLVKRTLDDYAYPIEGKENDSCGLSQDQIASLSAQIATASASEADSFPCRYKHLHVDAGQQHMNGELALEFSRSRHAFGVEGTDFARSERQHLVITAIRSKVLSLGTLANPVKVLGIFNILKDNINTDIQTNEIDDFVRLMQNMKNAKINNYVIDMGDESSNRYGLLTNPPVSSETGGQWVLAPRVGNGDFSEVQQYVGCIIENKKCEVGEKGIIFIKEKTAVKN